MNLKTKVISRQHSYSVDTCYLSEKMFSKCFFPDSKNSYLARSREGSKLNSRTGHLEKFWKLFVRSGMNMTTFDPQLTIFDHFLTILTEHLTTSDRGSTLLPYLNRGVTT